LFHLADKVARQLQRFILSKYFVRLQCFGFSGGGPELGVPRTVPGLIWRPFPSLVTDATIYDGQIVFGPRDMGPQRDSRAAAGDYL
jgi:hypothetical protein